MWRGPRISVVPQPALSEMTEMMRQVLVSGTGTRAAVSGFDLAGKTGTTSDFRDAWFIGFTGGFTTAVWTGRDDDSPMRGVTGGSAPAEIWHDFMAASLPRLNVQPIPGGPAPAPPVQDAIGDILSGANPEESGAPPSNSPPPAAAPPPGPPPPG